MQRNNVIRIALGIAGAVAAAVIVFVGARAVANEVGPHAMHHRMRAFIAGALDAAKADPAQRAAIEAARDRAMQKVRSLGEERRDTAKQALDLFAADKLDAGQVEAIKQQKQAAMRAAGDAIVTALTEAHDVLRPEQRKAVADYIRANRPQGGPGWRGQMMKRFATGRVEEMLDKVDASAAQRGAIEAARDHVFATVEAEMASAPKDLADRALAIFEADRVDPALVKALRDEHQARAARVADAVVQAIHDTHDALTSAQRQTVVATIRDRMARFGGHHHGFGHHHAMGDSPTSDESATN